MQNIFTISRIKDTAQLSDIDKNKRNFLMNASVVMGSMMLLFVGIVFITNRINMMTLSALWVNIIVAGIVWQLAKSNRVVLGARIFLGVYLLVISVAFLTTTATISVIPMFFICAVFGLIFEGGLVAYSILIWGSLLGLYNVFSGNLTLTTSSNQAPIKIELTPVLTMYAMLGAGLWLTVYLSKILKQSNYKVNEQASTLQQYLLELERKRAVGEDVSKQVGSMIAELTAIAVQQASGSKMQVTAIAQMTAFLEELTSTAQSITTQTEVLNDSTESIREAAQRVRQVSQAVSELGESGAVAIEKSLDSSQRLNEVYRQLNQNLTELNQQQNQIGTVVSTLQEISDETRLLALNAAIEAAGAGVYGDRFGVVAAEVKSLADKSFKSSYQINTILKDIEGRIVKTLKVAENGQAQMGEVLQTVENSGNVIRELVAGIYESSAEVEQIEQAAIVMDNRAQEIRMATNQQYNASNQAVETLQAIGTVASQTANGSNEVTSSTRNLEQLSHNLLEVFAA